MPSNPSQSSKTKTAKSKSAQPDMLRMMSEVKAKPWTYDFFSLARRIEANSEGPGFGHSKRPSEDPVRFGQFASMGFSPRSIHSIETSDEAPIIKLLFSGMFGPNGALPFHLTEWATDRRQHNNDNTLEKFADIFHHRFFSLFYRAWADSDPAVAMDNPDHADVFKKYIGAIGGVYNADSDDFVDYNRRFYMSHIGPSSSRPEALERVISDSFDTETQIVEYIGTWLELGDEDCAALGDCALGGGDILGNSVWSRTGKFEIIIGPISEEKFKDFLPGEKNAMLLREIVIALVGLDFDWQVRLLRKPETIKPAALNGTVRLGYDTWMAINPEDTILRDDLVLSSAQYNDLKQDLNYG